MRLLRDNTEDARVMRDLELLAGERSPDEIVVVADDAQVEVDADDNADAEVAEPSPLDDAFVSTFVRGSVHVRRYFPYYLGAALWVVVMLLMTPQGKPPANQTATGAFEQASSSSASRAPVADTAAPTEVAPSFADVAATPADTAISFDAPSPVTTDFAADAASEMASSPETSTFESSTFSSSNDTSSDFADEPMPLRITKSGYSSKTGGTPLEQAPPSDGLPVGAIGGEATKRSFIALSGDETVLHLKEVDDPSNAGADQALVRACPIVVDDWKGERGVSMDAEPAWAEPCVDGKRSAEGVWTFDLSPLGNPGTAAGFALTTGASATFNLTFEASAVSGA